MQYKALLVMGLTAIASIGYAQTESTAPVTEETTQTAAPVAATGSVSRSAFTSSIQNREPADTLTTADTSTGTLYFFTELKDMQGQTALHRWSFGGEQKAEVSFNVGSARWRVWSTKKIAPEWVGTWTVEVLDGNGNVLQTSTLEYSSAPKADAPTEETSTPVTETTPE